MPVPPLADELTDLLSVDVAGLTVLDRNAHMARLERARARFEAEALGQLAAFDEGGTWGLDAAYGTANWLTAHIGTAKADAGRRVRLARNLQSMPATAAALADGLITEAHARVLARGISNPRVRAAFIEAEPDLVVLARSMPADRLAEALTGWIELHDADGAEPFDPTHDTVSAHRVGDRVKVNGDLSLETGLPFLAAVEERMDQLFRRDQAVSEANPLDGLAVRSVGNRRAEALTELVGGGAGAESNPRRREPLFQVMVDEKTLRTGELRPDSVHELIDGTSLPMRVLEHWKCGAMLSQVVLDARRAMLNYGRTERYANREMRRALATRDRGCAVPGCDRPPSQCDAHHVLFWEDLGTTEINNLVLLCRHHHRMIHADRLSVEIIDGVPYFYDPFDRLLRSGRHRPWALAA